MSQSHNQTFRQGVTLVELLVALAVVAVLSTAVATMLVGAGHIHQYVNNETDAMSQTENAYRRMLHNIRTSSVAPTVSGGVLSVQTQPDTGYASGAVVTYQIGTVAPNIGALVEIDQRYGTNVLIPASASPTFVPSLVAGTTPPPTQVNVAITAFPGSPYQIKRTATVTCRNF